MIRFVQLTRAAKHSIKVCYYLDLVSALGKLGFDFSGDGGVEIAVVVPEASASSFRIGNCFGDLRQLGLTKADVKVYSFERSGTRAV